MKYGAEDEYPPAALVASVASILTTAPGVASNGHAIATGGLEGLLYIALVMPIEQLRELRSTPELAHVCAWLKLSDKKRMAMQDGPPAAAPAPMPVAAEPGLFDEV